MFLAIAAPPLGTGVFCDGLLLYLDAVEETEAEDGDATVLYIIKDQKEDF